MNKPANVSARRPSRVLLLALSSTVLASLASVLTVPALAADEAVRIRLATLAPDGSSWHLILKKMGERWAKAPGGGVKLVIYPGGVQGDEPDMISKMRVGLIQSAAVTAVGLAEIDAGVEALQVPMMFNSWEEIDYVRDRMKPVLEKRLEDKGFVVLNWGDAGWVRFFAKEKFARPDDVRKMKLFVWTADTKSIDLWKAAGFQVVPLAATDVLTNLQTGLINAFDTTPLAALGSQWFGLATHMLDMKWAALVGATVMTRKAWLTIPEAARAEVLKASRDAGDMLKSEIRTADQKAIEAMKSHGLQVTIADAATEAEWRKTAESAWPKIRGPIVPAEMFDEAKRLRDEYRATAGKPSK